MSELTKHHSFKKFHLGFCAWCGLSFSTLYPQAKYCGHDCKHEHLDAKQAGQLKERHAAALARVQRERDAHKVTAQTVVALFGDIFGLEWAP